MFVEGQRYEVGKDFKIDLALHKVKGSQLGYEPHKIAIPLPDSPDVEEESQDELIDEIIHAIVSDEFAPGKLEEHLKSKYHITRK